MLIQHNLNHLINLKTVIEIRRNLSRIPSEILKNLDPEWIELVMTFIQSDVQLKRVSWFQLFFNHIPTLESKRH